jgi:hypothetical protein
MKNKSGRKFVAAKRFGNKFGGIWRSTLGGKIERECRKTGRKCIKVDMKLIK